MFRLVPLLLCAFALGVASPAVHGQESVALPEPPADKALLVIIRFDSNFAGLRRIEFELNQQLVAALPNNSYTHLIVTPGIYLVQAQMTSLFGSRGALKQVGVRVNCLEGQRCYVGYVIGVKGNQVMHQVGPMREEAALKRVAPARFEAPVSPLPALNPLGPPVDQQKEPLGGGAPAVDMDSLKDLLPPQ